MRDSVPRVYEHYIISYLPSVYSCNLSYLEYVFDFHIFTHVAYAIIDNIPARFYKLFTHYIFTCMYLKILMLLSLCPFLLRCRSYSKLINCN